MSRGQLVKSATTDEEINILIHAALYGPWDESRCRICGSPVAAIDSSYTGQLLICGAVGDGTYRCSTFPKPKERADGVKDYMTGLRRYKAATEHQQIEQERIG